MPEMSVTNITGHASLRVTKWEPGGARGQDAAQDVVGRKSRRAQGEPSLGSLSAPDLSRAVRVEWSKLSLNANVGFGMIFGRCDTHGAAQIRRGVTAGDGITVGAPRFLPHRVLGLTTSWV